MSQPTAVTESSFDAQVFKPDIPVLVDFRASWCAPCRAVAEWLPEVAQTYAGRLKVVWVDVDQNSQITFRHRVRGIPTLVLYANGREVTRWEGAVAKDDVVAELMPQLRLD
jgi:thioredoxin 1